MQLYKVSIKLESALVTSLKGDTIWGHVVWGIANHEGDDAVEQFLNECKTDKPPFIVSSAFPKGAVCKHLLGPKEREENLSVEKYAEIKTRKKQKYENASAYFSNAEDASTTENVFSGHQVMHNSINRYTNTVIDGNLFAVEELWAGKKENGGSEKVPFCDFDIYVLSSYDGAKVKRLCEWAFENGYGADASVGKGKISVVGEPVAMQKSKSGNKYMALAPFVADLNDIHDLRADTFVRTGKVGGTFATQLVPWKKTVVLYDEGAVFTSETPIDFVGKILENVHADSRICQSGFAPVIPID